LAPSKQVEHVVERGSATLAGVAVILLRLALLRALVLPSIALRAENVAQLAAALTEEVVDRRRAALAVSIEPGDRAAKHVLDPGKANLVDVELELRSRERAAETERQAVLAEHAARRVEDATDLVVADRALQRRK